MTELSSRQTDLESLVPENAIDSAFRIWSLEGWSKIEQIGQSHFGKVWKYGTPLRRTEYAAGKSLKVQLFNLTDRQKADLEERVSKFIKELNILTKVSSECRERLVQFIGCYLDNKKVILFTEWMPNGSVKDHIIRHPLDEPTALKYIFQATQGLHFLHHYKEYRIVHRDIKCDNLLLTSENQVKLADFGLAYNLTVDGDSQTMAQSAPSGFAGPILFAAPEVLIREQYGRRSDIWSLGCTLVEMMTCQPPHSDFWSKHKERAQYLFLEQARAEPEQQLQYNGHELVPHASAAVHKLLDCLFIKNKVHRPKSEDLLGLFFSETPRDTVYIDIAKLESVRYPNE